MQQIIHNCRALWICGLQCDQRNRKETILPGALKETTEFMVGILPARGEGFTPGYSGLVKVLNRGRQWRKRIRLVQKSDDTDTLQSIILFVTSILGSSMTPEPQAVILP